MQFVEEKEIERVEKTNELEKMRAQQDLAAITGDQEEVEKWRKARVDLALQLKLGDLVIVSELLFTASQHCCVCTLCSSLHHPVTCAHVRCFRTQRRILRMKAQDFGRSVSHRRVAVSCAARTLDNTCTGKRPPEQNTSTNAAKAHSESKANSRSNAYEGGICWLTAALAQLFVNTARMTYETLQLIICCS